MKITKAYRQIKNSVDAMDDKEFLALDEFKELIIGQIKSILDIEDIKFLPISEESEVTAYTDGKVIGFNTWSPLVLNCKNRYEKYLSNIGSVSHEAAHILFTDFNTLNNVRREIANDTYSFSRKNEYDALSFENQEIFKRALDESINIMEDCYIENCISKIYPKEGILVKGLNIGNRIKFEMTENLNDLIKKIENNEYHLISVFVWMFQIKCCLGYEPKGYKDVKGKTFERLDKGLCNASNIANRYKENLNEHLVCIEELASLLLDFIDEDKKSNEQEEDSSENNDKGEDFKKEIEKILKNAGASQKAKGEGDAQRQNLDIKCDSNLVSDINKEISKNLCNRQIDKANDEKFEEMLNSSKEVSNYKKYTYGEVCVVKPESQNKIEYESIRNHLKPLVRSSVRKIEQILKKREDDEFIDGFYMGSKFNVKDVYRNDARYFSKEIEPSQKYDTCFSMMIDTSGSMVGENITEAKKSAVLLENIASELNIPLRIISHRMRGNIEITNIKNFEGDDRRKYTIPSLYAYGSNADTIVMTILCEEIIKRNEKTKVVLVISDGVPCITSAIEETYRGVSYKDEIEHIACKELNACVRYWRKKGIKIVAIALDDVNRIKTIYEEGVLDCSDLSKVPNALLKIIKKYVIKN